LRNGERGGWGRGRVTVSRGKTNEGARDFAADEAFNGFARTQLDILEGPGTLKGLRVVIIRGAIQCLGFSPGRGNLLRWGLGLVEKKEGGEFGQEG